MNNQAQKCCGLPIRAGNPQTTSEPSWSVDGTLRRNRWHQQPKAIPRPTRRQLFTHIVQHVPPTLVQTVRSFYLNHTSKPTPLLPLPGSPKNVPIWGTCQVLAGILAEELAWSKIQFAYCLQTLASVLTTPKFDLALLVVLTRLLGILMSRDHGSEHDEQLIVRICLFCI